MSAPTRSRKLWSFVLGAALVALLLAGIVSFYASSQPDGLEKVAIEEGFIADAEDHDLADSPLADYGVSSIDDARLSVGVSGVIGVALTLAVGGAAFWFLRRREADGARNVPAAALRSSDGAARRRSESGGLRGRGTRRH